MNISLFLIIKISLDVTLKIPAWHTLSCFSLNLNVTKLCDDVSIVYTALSYSLVLDYDNIYKPDFEKPVRFL